MISGLTWVHIRVGPEQRKILHAVLNWIVKHEGLETWNGALQFCCSAVIDYVFQSSWPLIVIPTKGPTTAFHYLRNPHPADLTDAVIGVATEEIGLDEGAALAHIAGTFALTWPEMAASKNRKVRALRTRLVALQGQAKAAQGAGTS